MRSSRPLTSPGLVGSGTTLPVEAKHSGRVSPVRILRQLLRAKLLRKRSHPLSYYLPTLHLDVDDTGPQQDVRGQGAGQFSSGEGFAPDETSGSADLRTAQAERDDAPIGAGQGAKPSVTSRAMGTSFLGCVGAR